MEQTQASSEGIVRLAKMFKERENQSQSEPLFGVVTSIKPLTVQLIGKKVLLNDKNLVSLINMYETDVNGSYVNLNKKVALLMFDSDYANSMPNFLILGVVYNG